MNYINMEKKTGRPCKKAYDSVVVMEGLLSMVDAVFEEKQEIKATAAELDLAELKVRQLLITSGKLHYPITEKILELQRAGKETGEIQNILGLSRASVHASLPYTRIAYQES